jgi:4-amino-4-deoxy-L-arabinose transferase-like glycosyltransferase
MSAFPSLRAAWSKGNRWLITGCLLALLIQFGVQLRLAVVDSQTTDEAVHITAGYTYLTTGDWRYNPEHPPLIKLLAALPVVLSRPTVNQASNQLWQRSDNYFYDSWRENRLYGEQFFYNSGNNPDWLLWRARLPVVIITLILGLVIFNLSLRWWGERAAVVATLLYAFNPTINGHGHLVTTDVGLALAFLLAVLASWQLINQPSKKSAVLAGLAIGVALLMKHTAIIIFPVLIVLLIGQRISHPKTVHWKTLLPMLLVAAVTTWITIWAGYGFHDRLGPKSDSYTTEARNATSQIWPDLSADQLPELNKGIDLIYKLGRYALLPGDYIKGLGLVVGHAAGGHSSYLLGQTSVKGWWYYFPVLLFTKETLPGLVLLLAGVVGLIVSRPKPWLVSSLGLAAGTFFIFAMASRADLGIRHVLPVLPPLFLVSGWALSRFERLWLPGLGLLAILAVIYLVSFPTYLGYFNPLAGGFSNGYKIAVDSNLDWGQDLHRIRNYVDAHQLQPIYVEYGWDGQLSLDYYLKNYRFLSDWRPGLGGYGIVGASAYATNEGYRQNCLNRQLITDGVFGCQLP